MCKTPKIRAGAGAPPEGTPPTDDVQIADRTGLRVSRSGLVNSLGFSRGGARTLSADTFGQAMSARLGFTNAAQ